LLILNSYYPSKILIKVVKYVSISNGTYVSVSNGHGFKKMRHNLISEVSTYMLDLILVLKSCTYICILRYGFSCHISGCHWN